MRVFRTAAIVTMGLTVLAGTAACGSSDSGSTGGAAQNQRAEAPADIAGDPGTGFSSGSTEADQGAPGAAGGGAAAQQPVAASERKVVRTAQLSVEVEDIYAAANRVYDIGARHGGYVSDEQTDDRKASIELKVDAKDLDTALTDLAGIGTRVTSRNQQAQDVTEQFVDLESRVATQRASVERIRALLAGATQINDIVKVEAELTSRQAELESLERRRLALGAQAELSTVTVHLFKPGAAPVEENEDPGFLGGLAAGWDVFVKSTQVLLTVLGALLPFLIALGIPAAAVVWFLRRRRSPAPATAAPPAASAGG